MSNSALAAGLRQLRHQLAAPQCRADSDEQLLSAFTSHRDENAFSTIVQRHGPMVLSVCRRMLGHEQDAEDAFQATFLVLARNTTSLRNQGSLAGFLHGIAYRLARDAKRSAARRRKHEGQVPPRPPAVPADELSWGEVRTLLDDEIARLPEVYRSVFVLCCLENLSRAEAAQRLGLKECTLRSRLTKARKRLYQQLARRGVELTGVLAATALAMPSASALPAGLTTNTMKAVLTVASGNNLVGVVSASVVSLVENNSPILSIGKSKLVLVLCALSLLAGSGALIHFQLASAEENGAPPAQEAKSQTPAAPAGTEVKESATYSGRVLDPEGKPVVGAKLYLLYFTPKELPIPVRSTSDKDGRFRFTVARKDFDQSSSARPWDEAIVVATAKGYGLGLPEMRLRMPVLTTDWKLQLSKDDVPITGRIIDLQGKPIAGVSVSIHELFWSPKEDLTAWLGDLKEKQEGYPTIRAHLIEMGGLWMGRDLGKVFPPITTGADGRFILRGVGRERVVALRLSGPTIASTELFAMTRPGDTLRVDSWRRGGSGPDMVFCGSTFEHISAPSQTIIGIVRDKDTGKPIPGAIVRSYAFAIGPRQRIGGQTHLRAVTDKQGRYRLDGMPKSEGNEIRAEGPEGQPYLMSLAEVPKGFALEPVTVDFELKHGVWIHGKVTEKATGKPVRTVIHCAVHGDNPFRKEARGLTFENNVWNRPDGSFRFVGLPGRSVVTAQTGDPRYLTQVGADRIKDLNRFNLFQRFNAVVEINPNKDDKEVRCDIALETGQTLSGKVFDSEGRPLSGANVAGLSRAGEWERVPLRTEEFTVVSLHPDETRLLQFSHTDKHLAGSLVLRGDAKGALTVTLKPAGTLKGRFVSPDGKPWSDLAFHADMYGPIAQPQMVLTADPAFGTFPQGLRTGKDGTFCVENLAPGLKYRFVLHKGKYALMPDGSAGTGVTVREGETKDLGDITVKAFE
jgi:RNA polymerase sigma factor (sigma-70 family)